MKLLYLAKDTRSFIDLNYSYLEQELANHCELTIWRSPEHISSILRKIDTEPSAIFIVNDIGSRMEPLVKGLANTNIPVAMGVNDVHRFSKLRKSYIEKNQIQHLFSVVRDPFSDIYPEYVANMRWFPHYVETSVFREEQMEKTIDFLMMGAVNDYYPLRRKILETFADDHRFVYHPHPGYRNYKESEQERFFIGRKYVQEINRAKIFFTSPSILHYPVKKYFEVLACKTLLLAPTFPELEDLGFIPGVHFIAVNEDNFKEQAEYYLKNEEVRRHISEQGYNFVRKHHSTAVRAKQLIRDLQTISEVRR
ncbi:glycosyltransferase involved in cell wall biosynthesis [Geomicrobium halophilum]|uniref:Glycosyltransferase involved in cell wall biosynthesis n=1 Tax=Geomicrobium halophilum TaxID=549000 RepID=A0A841PML9_9BACL|nr:glycosyltransferase involved in cell wall biosynthesis [Geomicrobium halophilum]